MGTHLTKWTEGLGYLPTSNFTEEGTILLCMLLNFFATKVGTEKNEEDKLHSIELIRIIALRKNK